MNLVVVVFMAVSLGLLRRIKAKSADIWQNVEDYWRHNARNKK
jgi:hypothetical protein